MGIMKKIAAAITLAFVFFSTPPALAQTGQTLTNDSLKAMLDNMGYEPKALSKGYLLAIKQDTWTFNMQLVLSADGTKLGMNANLGLVDVDNVAAKDWLNLLESNGDIDPSAFYVDRDQKKLYLHRVLDNHEITPAFLRSQIESFTANIKNTEGLWKFTK
jgi:hypothetical protein